MGVVAIAALHDAFKHFVMKRLVKVGLNFSMAAHTELGFTQL
jgi:hypothetical protein